VRIASIAVVLALVGATCGGGDASVAVPVATGNTGTTVDANPDTQPAATRPAVTSEPPGTTTPVDNPTSQAPSTADTAICATGAGSLPAASEPVRVILDTDFASDVDDVGALAILHALADAGEVEILAVMVSDGGDEPSHRAIDAINTFYARPDLPIGVVTGAAPAFPSAYVTELASGFPNDIEDPPAAVDLYRQILAGEPDNSVTIVSVGYLTNLDALLSSPPDERSASSGEQLVAAKVRRWVAMGGYYPDSVDHPFDAEFNFAEDMTATLNAVGNWPTPAVFSGWEIGEVVLTGAALQERTPPENPVREAYRLFNGGEAHRSWDLTAVLAAVRGAAGVFEVCPGRNVIGRGGSNRWQQGGEGPQGYLRLVVPADDVASVIDRLLIAPPGRS
jgi:inosine-uridine nucleoside N-ribohydrolase